MFRVKRILWLENRYGVTQELLEQRVGKRFHETYMY